MSARSVKLFVANTLIIVLLLSSLGWFAWSSINNFSYNWNWLSPLKFIVRVDDNGSWQTGLLAEGFITTLRLALWGGLLCLLFGLGIGLLRTSKLAALRMLGGAYVELIRNVPPLVFMFIMYFFVSSQLLPADAARAGASLLKEYTWLQFFFGRPEVIENFLSGLICIALYEAAYVAEIVRGSIQSIDNGQWEGAHALGLRRGQAMRLIILPQAFRKITPLLTNQLVALVKDSSIISVISVQELTFAGIEVATTTGRLFETLILISLLYLLLCWPISMLLRRVEAPVLDYH